MELEDIGIATRYKVCKFLPRVRQIIEDWKAEFIRKELAVVLPPRDLGGLIMSFI